jgi:hypothetical protein
MDAAGPGGVKACCHSAAPQPAPASCCGTGVALPVIVGGTGGTDASSCCAAVEPTALMSWGGRIRAGLRHGFVTMPIDLAVWLTIGFALAALVTAAVPENWLAQNIGTGLAPMFVMLLIGIPLYICATSSTPLAFSLVLAGMSPGAALVLLLAGPATNVATITWALKDLGARATFIYLVVISVVAMAAGWVLDAFFSSFVHLAEAAGTGEAMRMGWFYAAGAVAFAMLLSWSLTMKIVGWVQPEGE